MSLYPSQPTMTLDTPWYKKNLVSFGSVTIKVWMAVAIALLFVLVGGIAGLTAFLKKPDPPPTESEEKVEAMRRRINASKRQVLLSRRKKRLYGKTAA